MKEAIGQTYALQIILVFVVFLNAFLAFSVNYTKAFRVKNKIINELEQNEGLNATAKSNIIEYMQMVGYTGNIEEGECFNGACIVPHCIGKLGSSLSSGTCENGNVENYRVYYSVTTSININVPIINRIIDPEWNILKVKGDTSTIYINGNLMELTSWED